MTENRHVEESIKRSIAKAGFPEKTVRLPFRPVYKSCKENGTSLTTVLDHLREEHIFGRLRGDHIEFRASQAPPSARPEAASAIAGAAATTPGNLEEMARQAMAGLTPEQLAEIRRQVESMSDEEKKNLLKLFSERSNDF